MGMFTWEKWPLVVICVGMIAGGVIDGWKFKVPNWLTFPLIISGWILGAFYWLTELPVPAQADASNRLLASIVGTLVAGVLLGWMYLLGAMGAGDVKMTMGFGSWMGAYYGYRDGLWVIFYGFVWGALIGGVLAVFIMLFYGQYSSYLQHAREFLRDLATSKGSIDAVADKAAERKPRQTRLAYGVPLCIGFVGYLLYLNW